MAYYTSSNSITELDSFSIREKQMILRLAMEKMTVPQKLIINLLKLVLLIPPFLYLANLNLGMLAISMIIVTAAYVFVMRPVSLSFAVSHLPAAIKQFERAKAEEDEADE